MGNRASARCSIQYRMTQFLRRIRGDQIIVAISALAAFIIRFYQSMQTPLWYDEIFSLELVGKPWGQMFMYIAKDRVHPPLYYVLLKSITGVFGTNEVVLHMFSIVCGVAAVLLGYYVLKKSLPEKYQLSKYVWLALATFNPFIVEYSVEGRMYALFMLLIIGYFYAFYLYVYQKGRLSVVLMIGVFLVYTHFSSFIVLAVCGLYLFFINQSRKVTLLRALWESSLLCAVPIISLLPWFGYVQYKVPVVAIQDQKIIAVGKGFNDSNWVEPLSFGTLGEVFCDFTFGTNRESVRIDHICSGTVTPMYNRVIGLGLFLTFCMLLYYCIKSSNTVFVPILLLLCVYIVVMSGLNVFGIKLFFARYQMPLFLLLLFTLSTCLVAIYEQRRYFLYAIIIMLSISNMWALVVLNKSRRLEYPNIDIAQANSIIVTKKAVIIDAFTYYQLKRYAPDFIEKHELKLCEPNGTDQTLRQFPLLEPKEVCQINDWSKVEYTLASRPYIYQKLQKVERIYIGGLVISKLN